MARAEGPLGSTMIPFTKPPIKPPIKLPFHYWTLATAELKEIRRVKPQDTSYLAQNCIMDALRIGLTEEETMLVSAGKHVVRGML